MEAIEKLGIIGGDNRCQVLFENVVDGYSQGYHKGTVSSFAGSMEISQKGKKEVWLIFEANGYEGNAYLAMPFDPVNPQPVKDPILYVYTGC